MSEPTIRQEPSNSASVTTAGAIVIICNWLVKLKFGGDGIPGDVAMAMGMVLVGIAHAMQLGWLYFTDARVQPKPVLPPPKEVVVS